MKVLSTLVDWTILAKLEANSLSKVAIPQAHVTRIGVEKSSVGPGGPVLAWTVEVTDPGGEVMRRTLNA
jgi:hypothetical protein